MSKTPLTQVSEFHTKFGLPDLSQTKPRELTEEEALFRIAFMLEELAEYADCGGFKILSKLLEDVVGLLKDKEEVYYTSRTDHRDMEGELDALVDLSYVLHGTALFHGFSRFDQAFEHVHRVGNMTKVRATSPSQSKRGTAFDVVKPEGWTAPVLTEFLK